MSVSRKTLIYRAVQRLGGKIGAIASGSTTTAVLTGLVDTTRDDNTYNGDRLLMLDAALAGDQERSITPWTDLTGTATFAARTNAAAGTENYAVVHREDFTLAEFRLAMSTALRQTQRTYKQVIPLTPNLAVYPLDLLTWIEGSDDIDAVWMSDSPNMLHNEDFALWPSVNPAVNTSAVPDGWTKAGASATYDRVAGLRSSFGVTITRVNADATLYQSIPRSLLQYLTRSQGAPLPVVSVGGWVVSSTASFARIGVYNGSTTTWTSYHTGNGVPQFLSTTYQTKATDTDLRIVCSVDTTNGAGTFHFGLLAPTSAIPPVLQDSGSQAYPQHYLRDAIRNQGGWPVVELGTQPNRYGQLIVWSRRPFADMTADTDVVDDQYGRCLENGLLNFLLEGHSPNQDRERLDELKAQAADRWNRMAELLIDLPVPEIPQRVEIGGVA